MKRITALIGAAAMTSTMLLPFTAQSVAAAEPKLSGYISTERGVIELASARKAPLIYVDGADYAGVLRAANDLKSDIKAVTGADAQIKSETDSATGVILGAKPRLKISETPETAAQGVIAVYGKDGRLQSAGVSRTYADGEFSFDKALYADADAQVKGMVLSDDGKMQPLTSVYGRAEQTANLSGCDIVIGTIGKSAAIDSLIASGKLNVSEIEGEWEAFTVQAVDGALVIAGADKRGTIYGIYDLSEKMGVSPWEWWADVKPIHADSIYASLPEEGYTEGASSVKYRGVFINQEYNLWNWSKSLSDTQTGMDTPTYERIFELLLRLKANYLWPAMHEYTTAFNNIPENAAKADEYGIVMGTSHCEMLLRNNMGELLDFQTRWIAANPDKPLYMFKDNSLNADVAYDYTDRDKDGNAVCNKEFIEDYWRERVRANKDYESNFTIGMRGVHDGEWNPVNAKTTEEKIALLEEIIAKQRQILSEELGKSADEIPQTFIPYKEILPLYNAGLNVPEDVTIMWTNDNYGHIRQSSNAQEHERSGGGGMYYHVSYFGRPSSVIWNGGTQLGLIKEEMSKAYDCGADTVWVLNVGPMKQFENQMEYFLDLGRDMDAVRNMSVADYAADNAKRYFGFDEVRAREYADIQGEFLETANARRPDFMQQGIYSLTSYGDEGERVRNKYAELLRRSTTLYESLDEDLKPAFYQLQLYPVKSAYNVVSSYIFADKSLLYAQQGRGAAANKYAELSKQAWSDISADIDEFDTMLDSKWKNIINPFQKKESGSWDIMRSWKAEASAAKTQTVSELPYTGLGVMAENQTDISQRPTLEFSGYSKDVRFIDIFNKGTGVLDWRISADKDYVLINKNSGTVADEDRVHVGIDWDRAPKGVSTAKITVSRYIGETAVQNEEIELHINNEIAALPEKTYAESNGAVAIEAEHYSRSAISGGFEWAEQDDFGRSGTSMKFMPDTEKSASDMGAYLEYDINFESTGEFEVDVYRMPTLNERGGMSFALGMDEGAAVTLKGNNAYVNNSQGTDKWGKGILNNVEVLTAKVSVAEKGIHKLRLYGIDTGVVIDRLVITTGTKYPSYYGAPESFNTTYNNAPMPMPKPSMAAQTQTGDTTALFEPKLYISGAVSSEKAISAVNVIKLGDISSAKITAAAYDTNGVMLSAATTDADFTDTEKKGVKSIALDFAIPAGTAQIQLIAYDDISSLNALSPVYTENIEQAGLAAAYADGVIELRGSLDGYAGKEALCAVTEDESGELVYIRQERAKDGTFRRINTGALDGAYTVKIGVSGEGVVLSETALTKVNIDYDFAEEESVVYGCDFADGTGGTLSGNAVYDAESQAVKLSGTDKSGGTLTLDLPSGAEPMQGKKTVISAKVAYGRQDGKYTDFVIFDGTGKELVRTHICMYSSKGSVLIGGAEQLADGTLKSGDGIKESKVKDKLGINNGYTAFTAVLDPDNNSITLNAQNAEGSSSYSGKFPEGTDFRAAQLKFTTTATYAGRSSYVDDITLSRVTAPSYSIGFDIRDEDGAVIDNAVVGLTDAKYNTVVTGETDGTFRLCDGVYRYSVTADGYAALYGELDLSAATQSKSVELVMKRGQSTPTAPPLEPVGEYDNTSGHWLFDFGADARTGYYGVSADKSYTDKLDYGFIGVKSEDYRFSQQEHVDGFRMVQGQAIALENGEINGESYVSSSDSQSPIRFVMSAENGGYYRVKVRLVNTSESESACVTLFTEKRHVLLSDYEIEPSGSLEYEFNVDVETFYWKALNGKYADDTISVCAVGKNAAISQIEVTKAQEQGNTLWVLSDSTGCDQPTNFPYFKLASISGVGQALAKYLPLDIALSNQGDGGIASNDTAHYACVKDAMKAGDYMYVEYGHNETSADGYKSNLERYYKDCHAKGVKLIVVGAIDRVQTKQFDKSSGTWTSSLNKYCEKGREFVEEKLAAGADDIAFVDLNAAWIELMNATTHRVAQLRGADFEPDSVYYFYRFKPSGIDTTHINEAGADNAAYIFFDEARKIVNAAALDTADESIRVQAAVLGGLVDGMRENLPYTLDEDTVRAGKVPNSLYPEPVYEVYEGYEAEIKQVSLENGIIKSVSADIAHYTGFDRKDIPYAVAVVQLYNADGTEGERYVSDVASKYDATNGNGTFTLTFNDEDAAVPEGAVYRIWLQGFTSDNLLMDGDEYRVSDYYRSDLAKDLYLIGDKEDTALPDSFDYYGIRTGSDLSGNNGWYLVGSASKSAVLDKDENGGFARLSKSSEKSGSFVLYRAFESEVSGGTLVMDADLYYEGGYARFVLSNKTSKPTTSGAFTQRINSFTVNSKGELLDCNDVKIGDMPMNCWVHVRYTLDLDSGEQCLVLGDKEYRYSGEGATALAQLNVVGKSAEILELRIANVSLRQVNDGAQ